MTELVPGAPTRDPARRLARRLARHPGRALLRPRLLDPLLVGVVALVVYSFHGFNGLLRHDIGLFVYGGEQVAHGVPPYQDVFNSVGPLADAVPGAAIWVGNLMGADPVTSARVLFLLLSALCCSLLCVLARETFDSRAAGLLAPAAFLPFENFLTLAASGPREKTAMVVFLLAALILVLRQRWLAAGAFTALAALTWQPALFPAVAAAVVGALLGSSRRVDAMARFVAGGLGVTAVAVGYFALVGGLRTAVNGFFIVNLLYTHQPSAITQPAHIWAVLWQTYHLTLPLALAGLACLFVLAVYAVPFALPTSRLRLIPAQRLVTVGAGAAAGACWTTLVINGGPDLFVILPFCALGLAGGILLGVMRLPRLIGGRVLVAVVCASVAAATTISLSTRDNRLVLERADITAVLDTQPPSATILSIGVPEVLAIAQRTNPVPYQLFDTRMRDYIDHEVPGGLVTLRERLQAAPPTFIVRSTSETGRWPNLLLHQDYWDVGSGMKWTWYLNKSAGVDALLRARAANARVMSGG
jgi:hypothetical protein